MALLPVNKQFVGVVPVLDEKGQVTALLLTARYDVSDDSVPPNILVSNKQVTTDIWGQLTAGQKTALQTLFTRLQTLAVGLCPS